MASQQEYFDEKVHRVIEQYGIEGSVTEGGASGRVYDQSSRVFTAVVSCEGQQDTFSVYTGPLGNAPVTGEKVGGT